jgi:hypothetical protein
MNRFCVLWNRFAPIRLDAFPIAARHAETPLRPYLVLVRRTPEQVTS